MQKIIPFLWFDSQAEAATDFYVSLFENSKTGSITWYDDASAEVSRRAKGSIMTVEFELAGQQFAALNGGPVFNFTPAISFFVSCKSEDEIDQLYQNLSEGGEILMALDNHGFSPKFGWVNDRYGVSWQLNLAERETKIAPFLMFTGDQHGKAEEAMNFYTSLFDHSEIVNLVKCGKNEQGQEGTVMHAVFSLNGQEFMAIDSNAEHKFTFTPATSFLVNCDNQEEIDRFWDKLSALKEAEQCGWLQDKYGVSWQIVPSQLNELLNDPDPEKMDRVTRTLLKMKKLDIEKLKQAKES